MKCTNSCASTHLGAIQLNSQLLKLCLQAVAGSAQLLRQLQVNTTLVLELLQLLVLGLQLVADGLGLRELRAEVVKLATQLRELSVLRLGALLGCSEGFFEVFHTIFELK